MKKFFLLENQKNALIQALRLSVSMQITGGTYHDILSMLEKLPEYIPPVEAK